MTRKRLMLGGALGTIIALLLGATLPIFVSEILKESNRPERLIYELNEYTTKGNENQENNFSHPLIRVEIPKIMKLSDTEAIVVVLTRVVPGDQSKDGRTRDPIEYSAALSSPVFVISPSDRPRLISHDSLHAWTWLVKPRESGNHKALIALDKSIFSIQSMNQANENVDSLHLSPESIAVDIEVLTELGLTSFAENMWRLIGAIAGIVIGFGTILLPMLKS